MGGGREEAWVMFQMVGPGGPALLAIQGDGDDGDSGAVGGGHDGGHDDDNGGDGDWDDWQKLDLVGNSWWSYN